MSLSLIKKVIPPGLKLRSKLRRAGNRWRLNIPDRVFLEDTVIPFFRNLAEVKTVLDLGVDWYTRTYPKLFPGQEYWTIDIDPEKSRFASPRHHTLSATQLSSVFDRDHFDLVICNGVFGWGLDAEKDIVRALTEMDEVLRPGGFLVVGWNDNSEHRIENLTELVAGHFDPFEFPPTGGASHLTETSYRHRFDFFRAKETVGLAS